ncbi:site-specific integrase [Paracoccus sp. SSK6]|uniref:site-specific integrase n=1 Tax=Paracoccus sp. SSK6 TaxID=3143131 RepID=UPI00321B7E32
MTAASEGVWDRMIRQEISLEQAFAVIRGAMAEGGILASVAGQSAPPVIREEEEDAPALDPSIQSVTSRLIRALLKDGAANTDTCDAIRKTAALIEEGTGISDIRKMRQHHVVELSDLLGRLPPSYRKSAKEREMPLREIAMKAEQEGRPVGLAAGTTNRILQVFQQIVARAGDEGIHIDPKLRPTALRRKKTKRSRNDRLAFTEDQLRRIFGAPTWTGCANIARRHEPGDKIIQDGLYWLPLVAAYTGARREEIAGLTVNDLHEEGGVWCFRFDENEERGIKTESSIRKVPVHPHLIELGILNLRDGEGRLFPGLYRKSAKSKLGNCIDYNWRKIMSERLRPDELPRRCFHSFRHTVVDQLGKMRDIRDRVIKDILGHTPTSITDRVYGSDSEPAEMLEAIQRIPRVF